VEELEPIFSIQGIQYVNFQYDDCQEELDWIEARYPGKIINISEIDHYNDFESVAALMKCMDLLIAPAITVVELAGALGCKTWLLSNSSELFWRKIDSSGTDVWHNNTTHIEGDILGDKNSLVDKLTNKLRNWVCE
jgi:capsular polysaccharide export protein